MKVQYDGKEIIVNSDNAKEKGVRLFIRGPGEKDGRIMARLTIEEARYLAGLLELA